MRLFLSSYRFGADPGLLLGVTRGPCPIAVIANAADAWPPRARDSAVASELAPLRALGYEPAEVDLRDHVGSPESLRAALSRFGALWVRGGNTFVLRTRLALCGGDEILTDLVRSGRTAYAGYSAGACLVTPSLRGLEFSDDPGEADVVCGVPARWDGLGWMDYAIVPHAGDSALADAGVARTLEYLAQQRLPFRALDDDEVIVVDEA
ncbi:MAG: peptidase E [Rhodococcus sp. (in: high G+C Gram-positive bacteria)]|nr:peptidase E [Rhodococcus sp. (in: high G+C Gram-positive bacteria)]MDX5451457.1 peptidase E [Rhodococcus sp. (in: high G+C Gram-positive bacteria)]